MHSIKHCLVAVGLLAVTGLAFSETIVIEWNPAADTSQFSQTIGIGDTVKWSNTGSRTESVNEIQDGNIYAGVDGVAFAGQSYSFTFKRPDYMPGDSVLIVSQADPEVMRGTISITGPSTTTTTTTTSTTTTSTTTSTTSTTTTSTTSTTTTTTTSFGTTVVIDVSTAETGPIVGPAIPYSERRFCEEGWLLRGDSCLMYEYYREDTAYHASGVCRNLGASLMIMKSLDDAIYVRDIVQKNPDVAFPFIGLFYEPLSDTFRWEDGTVNMYDHWVSDVVDDASTCVIATDGLRGGAWVTTSCFDPHPYICQKPAMTRFVYELDIDVATVPNFGPEQPLEMVAHNLEDCLRACDADELCRRLIVEVSAIDNSQLHCVADSGNFGDGEDYTIQESGTLYDKLNEVEIPVEQTTYTQIGEGFRDGVRGTRPINAFYYDDYIDDYYNISLDECLEYCTRLNTCVGVIRNYNPPSKYKCRLMSTMGRMVSTVEKVDTYLKDGAEVAE